MLDLIFLGPFVGVLLLGFALWMRWLPYSRSVFSWLLASVLVPATIAWPLVWGVWPPDIFTLGSSRTLAEVSGPSGARYQVAQYWNHLDFYTTELRITLPDARKKVIELDGDDQKSWSVPLTVDEVGDVVTVGLSGHRTKKVRLSDSKVLYYGKA
jgi:hypothetical protein